MIILIMWLYIMHFAYYFTDLQHSIASSLVGHLAPICSPKIILHATQAVSILVKVVEVPLHDRE